MMWMFLCPDQVVEGREEVKVAGDSVSKMCMNLAELDPGDLADFALLPSLETSRRIRSIASDLSAPSTDLNDCPLLLSPGRVRVQAAFRVDPCVSLLPDFM